ncbi:MAG: ribosomal RNA small subunit methyltransferase H [delta proteobacterium ML8_F1]|nr:MAG: ribosomal RNA small subunit methyltransferase H [delta proteobacterium ML8_F1]
MSFNHYSVMLKEVIEGLDIKPDGVYLDGTLGGAGHARAVAGHLENGILIGIDQDQEALAYAKEQLSEFKGRCILVHDNFSNIERILKELEIPHVDGILLDLGVSSYQLDTAQRGFSYNQDAPLDMRMDQTAGLKASDVVNDYSEEELSRIIMAYGEERWAQRIAAFIVTQRSIKPIETTFELVEVIKKAIPKNARRDGPHPAKRTFQAIRIEVNNELGIIQRAIEEGVEHLAPGGRIAVITFHSLEDRLVKNTFKTLSLDCICPPEAPICTCNHRAKVRVITRKPLLPGLKELEFNPRSRSAKLRIAEKL